jgi:hypothetical protein
VNVFILKKLPASASEFVEFWSQRYHYELEELYERYIKTPHSTEAVEELFRWKNGTRLSSLKKASVEKNFIARINDTARLSVNTMPAEFLKEFANGGAIWRIFWLHCWNQKYPIYD